MRGGWAAKKSCMFWCDDLMTASRICSASSNLTEPPMALQQTALAVWTVEHQYTINVLISCTWHANRGSMPWIHTWQSFQRLLGQRPESQQAHLWTHLHICILSLLTITTEGGAAIIEHLTACYQHRSRLPALPSTQR